MFAFALAPLPIMMRRQTCKSRRQCRVKWRCHSSVTAVETNQKRYSLLSFNIRVITHALFGLLLLAVGRYHLLSALPNSADPRHWCLSPEFVQHSIILWNQPTSHSHVTYTIRMNAAYHSSSDGHRRPVRLPENNIRSTIKKSHFNWGDSCTNDYRNHHHRGEDFTYCSNKCTIIDAIAYRAEIKFTFIRIKELRLQLFSSSLYDFFAVRLLVGLADVFTIT